MIDGINIFPNPSNGKFIISIAHNSINNISVYNLLGEKIIEKKIIPSANKEIEIDLSAQAKGIYLLQVKEENKLYCQKLVIE